MTAWWRAEAGNLFQHLTYQSPVYVCVALAVLFVSIAVMAFPIARLGAEAFERRLASLLRRTGLFTDCGLQQEILRLDLLRVVLAAFLLNRFWPDFVVAWHSGNGPAQWSTSAGLILAGALLFGVATPLIAVALAFLLNLVIDYYIGTESLGSVVVANCLIPMMIAPAGYAVSVDSWVVRRHSWTGRVMRALYGLWGRPTVDRIQVGRFFALCAYATINVYSAVKHLGSPTWTSGAATGVVLLSDVASPSAAPAVQWVYEHASSLYGVFSLVSTYGMLLWQLLLLPLALLSRWTRRFAVVWGLGFFVFTTYVMHLKRLGVYEFILWGLVFWNGEGVPARWWGRLANWFNGDAGADSIGIARHVRFPGAITLSFVGLWTIFLAYCLPHSVLAVDTRIARYFGRAPLVFGVGRVNVFNETDLRIFRNHAIPRRLESSGELSSVSFAPSEAVNQALTGRLYADTFEPVFCDPEFAAMWFAAYASTLPPSHADHNGRFVMEFTTWTHPSNRELATFRKAPLLWETLCTVTVDLRQPGHPITAFFAPAVPGLTSTWTELPSDVGRLNLAARFPCKVEVAAASNWYNAANEGRGEERVQLRLGEMWNGAQRGPIPCLIGYRRLVAELARIDRVTSYANPTNSCDAELAASEQYFRALSEDPRRHDEMRMTMAAIASSARRSEAVACRQAGQHVREIFFDAVFGPDR